MLDKNLLKYGTIVSTGLVLAACGNEGENDTAENQAATDQNNGEVVELSVGVVGEIENEIWQDVANRLEDRGIDLSVEVFSDYVQPNVALAEGSLDLNAFQHMAFLNEYLESSDEDLLPAGYTYIQPMAAYSDQISSLDEIENLEEEITITIPNDPTNGGRALLLLEQAGLIEVDDEAGITPTTADVTDNPHNITIEPVEASQVPRTLGDATAVVANTGIAVDAGLDLEKDSIYVDTDDLDNLPAEYKNLIAVRSEDIEDEAILTVVDEFQQPETEETLDEVSDGTTQRAWTDDDDILADFEASQEN